MAKVTNKTQGFNSITRELVFDNKLSDRARFIYVYMACKPDGWEFYQDVMAKELGYSKDTLRKYLDELICAGWITEEEQHRDGGKFGCLQYTIEIEKNSKKKKPIREITDTEKNRIGKNHNQRNIDNVLSEQSSSNNKEIENKKRLSNDNQKVHDEEDELSFPSFYKLYPLKRSKPAAERAWKKLSAADKRMAIEKIQVYIADCVTNKRSFQYPATYLNQRTFEDDFGIKQKIAFYDPLDTDTDEQKRFKAWMRVTFPEIENTALPLSYDDYMRLIGENKEYVEQVTEALYTIDGEIWKYRKSDIAKVVQSIIS